MKERLFLFYLASSSSSSSSSCNYKEVEDCVTAAGGLPSLGGEHKW